MSNSRQSDFSLTSESPRRTGLDIDGLMRDTVAMERIAGALENIADAMLSDSKLRQQEYDKRYPVKLEPGPVTVFEARYRTPRDEEDKPIELEDEIEIDKATGQAKVKPGVSFHEEPKRRSTAASRRRT